MSEKANDSFSVESGSCDCSDYTSDISWFYLSKNLNTSHIEFTILKDKNTKKNLIEKELPETKKDIVKQQNEIESNINEKPKKIEIPKYIKNENNIADNFENNIKKKYTNYRSKYKMALKNHKGLELYLHTEKNKDEPKIKQNENLNEIIQQNKKDEENNIKPKMNNRHLTNKVNRNRFFNINMPKNENDKGKNNSFEKNNDINKEKENEKKEDNKNNINENIDPKKRVYNYYQNINRFREKYKKQKDNLKDNINDNPIIPNKEQEKKVNINDQIRGKTLKERVVNETKNIVLQPGQSIKPKIVTKRKLKPNTTIVTNDDGTQNIITENTYLTTTTINELIDSPKEENDNYPLDIQLVRQHITKTYITEIESSPYIPKKRFSHFN